MIFVIVIYVIAAVLFFDTGFRVARAGIEIAMLPKTTTNSSSSCCSFPQCWDEWFRPLHCFYLVLETEPRDLCMLSKHSAYTHISIQPWAQTHTDHVGMFGRGDMGVGVYVFVCRYVWVCVYVCVCVYVSLYAWVCICMCIYVCMLCRCVCVYVFICVCTCVCMCVAVCVHACVCVLGYQKLNLGPSTC